MSQLTLKTLDCIKKQDVFSDKVAVFVNGTKVTGDIKIDKNDPPFLIGAKVNFTDSAKVMLTEVDKHSAEDSLGTQTVRADDGTGTLTLTFQGPGTKLKFDYRLKYEVSA